MKNHYDVFALKYIKKCLPQSLTGEDLAVEQRSLWGVYSWAWEFRSDEPSGNSDGLSQSLSFSAIKRKIFFLLAQ